MPKLFVLYPDGVAGAALLLMRFSCAAAVFPAMAHVASAPAGGWLAVTASLVLVLILLLGFCTRLGAVLEVLIIGITLTGAGGDTFLLLCACAGNAGALALLGPGAWSIDALRYGRRVIRVGPHSPDRGSVE